MQAQADPAQSFFDAISGSTQEIGQGLSQQAAHYKKIELALIVSLAFVIFIILFLT